MRAVLSFLLLLVAFPAGAQSGEDGYVATRNAASADLKRMAQMPEYNPTQDLGKPELFTAAFRAEYDRHRRDVELQLRDVIGPVPPLPGFTRISALNPALCCYGRFGALDGLSFEGQGSAMSGNRVIVSTESLLRRWLNESTDFWPVDNKPSSDLPILFTTPSFYLWTRASDWPVVKRVDLPIGLIDNATAIGAFLASAQPGADWLAISVVKAGKVFVSFTRAKTPMQPIAACDATQQPAIYRECWSKQAREQPWFADLLLEVVAYADALPN
jgi:hypothetical protein